MYECGEPLTLSSSQTMSSIPENCLTGYLHDFSRARSILSQLHLRISSSSAESSLPFTTDCDNGTIGSPYSPTLSSTEVYLLFPLPQPLTADLIALGLSPTTAQYLSDAYMKAATRLKAKLETELHRADYACTEIKFPEGFATPQSQPHIRAIYASHFKQTVKSWIEIGMLSTRQRLLITSLKNRLRTSLTRLRPVYSKKADSGLLWHTDIKSTEEKVLDVSKMKPSPPFISISKKTKQYAGLATRPSTSSSCCHRTPNQRILEPTPAPIIKADLDAGFKSNEGAAIKGAEPQGFVGKNHYPTSWDLTSFIHDFDGLSFRDRSEAVSSGNEDAFGTCKVSPSERISNLFKPSSSTINCLTISAGAQSTASSSRPRSPLQSPYDGDSHSASSLSISKTIQSARRRKIAPCPNRERSTPSAYRGSDAFFPRQTNDMTVTSSVANATKLSAPTSHRLSLSASTHIRRRKIAPLPPRHPSTTTTDLAVIISPDVRRSSQKPSHKLLGSRQSTTGTPGRLTRPLTRSPSLTSLSSDESSLSCSDELETPPSSPTLPSTSLPTTSPAFSVSHDEYRFLSESSFHNISPAPQLLKAEIP
uniref:A2 mating type protein n=1 Tax=Heterobasidion abietinum TaxID=207833 RepID=S5RFB2_9AGAM|nr:a2 mating type protein [Heterobasidion abietinum]AGS09392.1 a2 mating type protein [Heterobasidion abietinum]